jgi:phosphoribosylamine--glycine ligase
MILDILDHKPVTVQYNDQACLGVVMAADGYPGSYPKGLPIGGLDALPNIVFHMGTKCEDGRWLSNGGRVLCVVGQGDTLVEAQHNAYDGVAKISAEGLFLRKDIGWQAV